MHAAQLAHTFLASSAPAAGGLDASNPTVFLGLLVAGLITVITLVDKVDGMVQRRKRTPAIEAEFVTKQEFYQLQLKVESELKITRIAIEKLTTTINADFKTLYRALGKVEGVTLEDTNHG